LSYSARNDSILEKALGNKVLLQQNTWDLQNRTKQAPASNKHILKRSAENKP